VTVGGKALIDHVLDRLADAGVETAVVNIHHFADQMTEHLAKRTHPEIRIVDERAGLLDSGGGIRNALPLLGKSPSSWPISTPSGLTKGSRPSRP